jgi:deoxyribonuclease V
MACVIVFSLPDLEELEAVHAEEVLRYPYIPGLLSFRECPVLISAFEKLSAAPDVAMFDGQGIAHPRGLGLASHMGLLLGIPTIGCAKSRLVGHHREPGVVPGSFAPLRYKGDFMGRESIVGVVLRTRKGVRPVYVSPGHMVDLRSAIGIAMMCVDGRRIPRPTREADRRLKHLKGGHPSD